MTEWIQFRGLAKSEFDDGSAKIGTSENRTSDGFWFWMTDRSGNKYKVPPKTIHFNYIALDVEFLEHMPKVRGQQFKGTEI